MISTFQALAVALFAVLPGASYTFAYERVAGSFGVAFADRIVRFLAASAVFGAVFSGPGLVLYRRWIASGDLVGGRVSAVGLEVAAIAYVVLPTLLGSWIGWGAKRKWRWLMPFVGESPEPRAWDFLWRSNTRAILRIKLKSGSWLAGIFAISDTDRRSYAAGYPEAPDIFLSTQLQIDAATGEFVRDSNEEPVPTETRSGLLLRWDEVEYFEVQEF